MGARSEDGSNEEFEDDVEVESEVSELIVSGEASAGV